MQLSSASFIHPFATALSSSTAAPQRTISSTRTTTTSTTTMPTFQHASLANQCSGTVVDITIPSTSSENHHSTSSSSLSSSPLYGVAVASAPMPMPMRTSSMRRRPSPTPPPHPQHYHHPSISTQSSASSVGGGSPTPGITRSRTISPMKSDDFHNYMAATAPTSALRQHYHHRASISPTQGVCGRITGSIPIASQPSPNSNFGQHGPAAEPSSHSPTISPSTSSYIRSPSFGQGLSDAFSSSTSAATAYEPHSNYPHIVYVPAPISTATARIGNLASRQPPAQPATSVYPKMPSPSSQIGGATAAAATTVACSAFAPTNPFSNMFQSAADAAQPPLPPQRTAQPTVAYSNATRSIRYSPATIPIHQTPAASPATTATMTTTASLKQAFVDQPPAAKCVALPATLSPIVAAATPSYDASTVHNATSPTSASNPRRASKCGITLGVQQRVPPPVPPHKHNHHHHHHNPQQQQSAVHLTSPTGNNNTQQQYITTNKSALGMRTTPTTGIHITNNSSSSSGILPNNGCIHSINIMPATSPKSSFCSAISASVVSGSCGSATITSSCSGDKREEFLKATMKICLVVSPPSNKLLQVNKQQLLQTKHFRRMFSCGSTDRNWNNCFIPPLTLCIRHFG